VIFYAGDSEIISTSLDYNVIKKDSNKLV